ncbi:MAG: FAD-dependent oxidoreductase [Gemmatimonadota bacterium]
MSDDPKPASGPDLATGISSDTILEGQSLAGRVGDDAVLLARSGGRCFAIGATCTHYGGPLAEGIVVDGTVRCPWHHAAFRLDTGDAIRAPALDALPCWQVEESNGVVRVLGRAAEPSTTRPTTTAAHPRSVVIIGAGAAGIAAAIELRKEGYEGSITMVDSDPNAPVDRPNLSKDYLAGTAQEEWVTLRQPEFFREKNITLTRARVIELDTSARRLQLEDASSVEYDALLIATGASPIQLPLPNDAHLPMYTLRSLADSRAIIHAAERAGSGARVAILGASFIGLEVAASLRARGLDVHVVAPETRPLERVLGPELGDWLHRLHAEHGVVFHLGEKPRELVATGVVLESGGHVDASFVVAGVGVRPNVELAERAGIHVDKGVVVDARFRTSASGVFAAGDIARFPDAHSGQAIRVEHWVAAERQGQAAARSMLGSDARFTEVPFFWSAHYDATVSYVGHAERWDAIEIDGSLDQRDCAVRYVAGGKTLAVATLGRDRTSLEAELSMDRSAG